MSRFPSISVSNSDDASVSGSTSIPSSQNSTPLAVATPTTPSIRERRKQKSSLSVVAPAEKERSYSLSDSGTFSDADIRISKSGLQVDETRTRTKSPLRSKSPQPSLQTSTSQGSVELWEVSSLDELDILKPLGQGASGVVKLCKYKPANKFVALKVMPLELEEKARKQILSELRTLHKTSSPYLVGFHGAFYHEAAIYVVLEYMDRGTVADLIQAMDGEPMPELVIARMAVMLVKGLVYLHKEIHVLHRDIKPSNLLLNKVGRVKISDLGMVGELNSSFGQAASFVGTITYMSPERLLGGNYSYESDIWSIGLTLLECALGHYPYESAEKKKPGFFELIDRIVKNNPPDYPPEGTYSPEFIDFIQRCLQTDEKKRPKANDLMKHPWIRKHLENREFFDLGEWIDTAYARHREKQAASSST